jgi:bifunctional DNA-binding transcriptional regulator/antitoxin component of YhaV-PrlF toxin-antitoxin module
LDYQYTVGKNNEIPLPDEFCEGLDIKIGDILICENIRNTHSLSLKKHGNQALSDDDIALAGNLTRVVPYNKEQEINAD